MDGSSYTILSSAHTVYLCVLCGFENKKWLFTYTALTDWFYNRNGLCLLRSTDYCLPFKSHIMPRRLSVFLQSAALKPNKLSALSGTKPRYKLSAPSASLRCDEFQIHRNNSALLGSYSTLLHKQLVRTTSIASEYCEWENITSNSTRKLRRNL